MKLSKKKMVGWKETNAKRPLSRKTIRMLNWKYTAKKKKNKEFLKTFLALCELSQKELERQFIRCI